MRIVMGIDWSEQAQAALQAVVHLYTPTALTLVHAVNLGRLESYPLVPVSAATAHRELERAKQGIVEAARERLRHIASRVPGDVSSVEQVCKAGDPTGLILDAVRSTHADLVAVGRRGLSQFAELVMGSISHRVLLYATCPPLIVVGSIPTVKRVLVAVKGPQDAARLERWLLAHPFNNQVDLTVLGVVPAPEENAGGTLLRLGSWTRASLKSAHRLTKSMATALTGPHYRATAQVATGDPTERIVQEAAHCDLLIVSSHGRRGIHRFLLGSVSHSVVHRVACPVLVVR